MNAPNALERLIAERTGFAPPPSAPLPAPRAMDLILQRSGQTPEEFGAEAEAQAKTKARPYEVPDTSELRRVAFLPRRARPTSAQLAELVTLYTAALRTMHGTQTLRPLQALTLHELRETGGAFAAINVGGGKTLISWLAITLCGAKRPLLIVPASLVKKTRKDFLFYAQHWIGPPPSSVRIESYEYISLSGGAKLDDDGKVVEKEFLERYAPDLLILDEVQKISRASSAVTARFKRHMKRAPLTKCVALSGTITNRSLRDYAHVLEWCLPNSCPVPVEWEHVDQGGINYGRQDTLGLWADALDEKVSEMRRLRPGALLKLASADAQALARYGAGAEIQVARNAFRDRLIETKGVIASQEADLPVSLTIREYAPATRDGSLEPHFQLLRNKNQQPDGKILPDSIAQWAAARQMGLGFFYTWWDQAEFVRVLREGRGRVHGQAAQLVDACLALTRLDPVLAKALGLLQIEHEWAALGMPIDEGRPLELPGTWGRLLRLCPEAQQLLIQAVIAARPPQVWLDKRKAWAIICRDIAKTNGRNLDTEAQIARAVLQGLYYGKDELEEWRETRPTFEPKTEAVWLSYEALDAAAQWASQGPGLIWVEHVEFALELVRRTGLEYYGREGLNAKGSPLESHPPHVPCIAGIQANSTGRNLQAWNRNLVMCPPSNGKTWEQLLGRTHRSGQERDVTVDVWLGCQEHGGGYWQAVADAQYVVDTTGAQQKLGSAKVEMPDLGKIQSRGGSRWQK